MTTEKQTVVALKWAGLSRLGGQLISWGATIVVLRLLMPEDYGLMAILTVVISLLGSMAELGLGSSVVQAPKLDPRDLSRLSGLVFLVNGVAFALVLVAAPLFGEVFGDERLVTLVRVAALQFLLNALCTVPQAIAFRAMDFRYLAGVEIAAIVFGSATTLALAWQDAGVWALLCGSLAQGAGRALLLQFKGWVKPEFSVQGIRRFVEFGGTVALSRLAWQVVFQSDVLIAGRRLSPGALGLYSVSLQLATLPMQKIMGVINQVAFPAVARMQGDAERLRARLVEAVQLLTVFGIAVMWGISAVAPEFVGVFLGAKWAEAVLPLQVMALIVPVRMINAVFSTAVIGVGKAHLDLLNSLICAIVLPAAFYVGTHWGPNGLALAWIVAIPLVTAVNLPRMAGAVGVRIPEIAGAVWRPLVAGGAMYGAVAACRRLLDGVPDVIVLPALIVAGAAVYLPMLHWLLPSLRGRLWQLLRAAS